MAENKTQTKILELLLKEFQEQETITTLANKTKTSRVNVWKAIKELQQKNLIIIENPGNKKTSTNLIKLNWNNPLLEKKLTMILLEKATQQTRWQNNFKNLKNKVDFLILFGSIIHSPKDAKDIDLLGIASQKKFIQIDETIQELQKTQIKKIHNENLTKKEFEHELKKPNFALIDSVKKGIILFGEEEFVNFIKKLKNG